METTTYTCDRCNKQSTQDRYGWMMLSETFGGKVGDLCPECKEKLFSFMKKKPYKD
jgi:hypothetical protein